MKLISFIAAILLSVSGFAQKQFEGTIVYQLHSSEDKEDAKLIVQFGKNALKLSVVQKDAEDRSIILVRVDSGKIYTLNTEERNYTTRKLFEKEKITVLPEPKTFAGFNAKPIDLSDGGNSIQGLLRGLYGGSSVVFYVADSLVYTIPEIYSLNPELAIIQKNRIVLGADVTMSQRSLYGEHEEDDGMDQKKKTTINVAAISVKWETFPDTEFSIPSGFAKYSYKSYNGINDSINTMATGDSLRRIADSIEAMRMYKAAEKAVNDQIQSTNPKKTTTPVTPKPKPGNPSTPARKPDHG